MHPVFWASLLAIVVAAVSRWSGMAPPSFWLDDQWAALVYRDFSWGEIVRLAPPIPLGFVLLQRPFAASMVGLQWVPFVASLACIPLMAWTVERVTRSAGAAAVAALVAAGTSLLAMAAVHPKHYSVDVLVAATLLALFVPVFLEDPLARARKNLWVVGACALGLGFAFTSVFVAAPLAHVAAVRVRRPDFSVAVALYDLVLVGAYFGFFAGSSSEAMTGYWAHAFVPLESVAAALSFLAARTPAAVGAALPSPWLAWFALPGLVWLLRRPELRLLGCACLGVQVALVVLAIARIYPLGTGRTDLFLAPVIILLVGCGLHALLSWLPNPRLRQVLLLAAALAVVALGYGRVPYAPETRDAQLVQALDAVRKPGEPVLVFPHAAFALAYHGDWEYEPVPWTGYAHGFNLEFASPDLTLLPALDGYLARPRLLDPALDDFLASAPDSVHYYATPLVSPAYRAAHAHVLGRLGAAGYRVTVRRSSSAAVLLRFER